VEQLGAATSVSGTSACLAEAESSRGCHSKLCSRLTSPPSLPSLSFRHDEGSYISSLATNRFHSSSASSSESSSSFQKFLAVGGESGVVSVYDLLSPPTAPATGPIKVKDVMNLTTKVSTMALHPSGQLLAVGSDQKKDQLRMVHLPSCSVFGNWPTARTPLGKVRCVDFSQGETLLPRTPHPPSFLPQMGAIWFRETTAARPISIG
jgi:WD40 repeat protein